MMEEMTIKTYTASMPIKEYDDLRLKLVCYGTAYIDIQTKMKNYYVQTIAEEFQNNEKAECRTLNVKVTYAPLPVDRKDLN